ncbi:sensor histidine kinase [Microbacterium sp. JZ101]
MPETAPAADASTSRAWERMRRIFTGTGLVVIGFVVETVGIANVPIATADGRLTQAGTVLWLVTTALWATVFARRTHPVLPLIAGAVLALIGVDYLLLLVATHHLLLRLDGARALRLAIGASCAVALFVAREMLSTWGDDGVLARGLAGDSGRADPAALAAFVIVIAVGALLVTFGATVILRSRRESDVQRARADIAQDRAEALGEEVVRQAERERLARDIHDALAHRLSVISLQSGALEEASRSQDPTVARAALTLRQQAHQSLEDLRGLLGELRSAPRTEHPEAPPTLASMRQLGHLIRSVRESGATVDALVLIEDAEGAGAALDRTVYRVVQESLTNALKHAPGAPVSVYVEASPSTGARIRVSNPLPIPPSGITPGASRGIAGIRERVAILQGTAWIGEADGHFIVDVTLPWPEG